MFSKTFRSFSAGKQIAYLAVFVAISVVVDMIGIDISASQKFSFTATANFLAGSMFGPVGGFAVACIGDLVGCFVKGYAPNPFIMLAAGLFGLIPGIIMTHMRGNVYAKAAISFLLCLLVCTVGINTYATYFFYSSRSVSYWAYMLSRLPFQCIVSAVNCVLSMFLIRAINRAKGRFWIKIS